MVIHDKNSVDIMLHVRLDIPSNILAKEKKTRGGFLY